LYFSACNLLQSCYQHPHVDEQNTSVIPIHQETIMAAKEQQAQERALVKEALKIGPQADRRQFFVSAAAFGAAATVSPLAMAQQGTATAPAAPARKALLKDDSRLLNIGATVRSGNYWDFNTYMTPVEQFYVRNHYPTPLVEAKPVLDPKQWKMKIHGNAVERSIEISYEDLMKMPSRTVIATMEIGRAHV
jgi:hypothetical protein